MMTDRGRERVREENGDTEGGSIKVSERRSQKKSERK